MDGDALGEEVSGAVDGRIILDAAEGRQSAKLAFAAAELSAFGAAIASGDFSARIVDALGDPSVTGEAALGGFRGFGAAVRSAKLSGGAAALLGDDPAFDAAFAADGVTTGGAEVERIEGAAKGAVSKFDARVRVLRAAAGAASLASLDAKLTAEGAATPDPRIALSARAESGAAGDIRISRADLSARGPLSALRARLSARGEGPGDEPLALDAEATAAASRGACPPVRPTAAPGAEPVGSRS